MRILCMILLASGLAAAVFGHGHHGQAGGRGGQGQGGAGSQNGGRPRPQSTAVQGSSTGDVNIAVGEKPPAQAPTQEEVAGPDDTSEPAQRPSVDGSVDAIANRRRRATNAKKPAIDENGQQPTNVNGDQQKDPPAKPAATENGKSGGAGANVQASTNVASKDGGVKIEQGAGTGNGDCTKASAGVQTSGSVSTNVNGAKPVQAPSAVLPSAKSNGRRRRQAPPGNDKTKGGQQPSTTANGGTKEKPASGSGASSKAPGAASGSVKAEPAKTADSKNTKSEPSSINGGNKQPATTGGNKGSGSTGSVSAPKPVAAVSTDMKPAVGAVNTAGGDTFELRDGTKVELPKLSTGGVKFEFRSMPNGITPPAFFNNKDLGGGSATPPSSLVGRVFEKLSANGPAPTGSKAV